MKVVGTSYGEVALIKIKITSPTVEKAPSLNASLQKRPRARNELPGVAITTQDLVLGQVSLSRGYGNLYMETSLATPLNIPVIEDVIHRQEITTGLPARCAGRAELRKDDRENVMTALTTLGGQGLRVSGTITSEIGEPFLPVVQIVNLLPIESPLPIP
jgi:hypothetical protein